tara:strand:- start:892 stop:1338 length:447 start_codon:yes stop_codon:yes gene_type:complete
MTLQIIITAYILVFLGIIYLTWNHFFNSPEDISHTMEKDTKADSEIENGFEGKKVVFDGELDAYREENIKNELRNKHAIVEDKMAEDTNFLITGKNPDWLVVEEAKDLGVTIVNEMDWQNTVHKIETNLSAETKLLREGNEVDSAEIV